MSELKFSNGNTYIFDNRIEKSGEFDIEMGDQLVIILGQFDPFVPYNSPLRSKFKNISKITVVIKSIDFERIVRWG